MNSTNYINKNEYQPMYARSIGEVIGAFCNVILVNRKKVGDKFMSSAFFEVSMVACQRITKIFDMVWSLDAGLWNLRQSAIDFFEKNPTANNTEAKEALVDGLYVHGLNLKRIAYEHTWEQEEEFIAEILLVNAIAIFDTWVDGIVMTILPSCSKANKNLRENVAEKLKQGDCELFVKELKKKTDSTLKLCFKTKNKRPATECENLWKVYRYFKSCRNCFAHGNSTFTQIAEKNYKAVKELTKEDCGLKEMPLMVESKKGESARLKLRGVVGFYDVLIRIILHYDAMVAETKAIENEILKHWKKMLEYKKGHDLSKSNIKVYNKGQKTEYCTILMPRSKEKREKTIRNYIKSFGMYEPLKTETYRIYSFLEQSGVVEEL